MRLTLFILGLTSLSQQISAGLVQDVTRAVVVGEKGGLDLNDANASAESELRRRADAVLDGVDLARRYAEAEPAPMPQAAGAAPAAQPTTVIPTINQTQASCNAALSKMNGVPSNPSGMSSCYNIDLFDNSTGDFRAHVIIYQIGAATGEWTSLKPGSMSVDLRFPGASVAPGPSLNAKRNVVVSRYVTRSTAPTEMQDLVFVGQIDAQYLSQTNNASAMRAALDPDLQVSAMTASGQPLIANMSNTEASFVDGFFSNEAATTSDQTTVNGPFVLPGTHLGIFPTGLIITLLWSVFFIAAVGAGTYGRKGYRDAFRRRSSPMQMAIANGQLPSSASKQAAYDKPSYDTPKPL